MTLTETTLETYVTEITPETAAEWIEGMQYKYQRPFRKHHVGYLAEEMRRGNFVQGTLVRVATYQGRQLLIDGQHRLRAVVESNMPQVFTVLEVQSDTEDDVAWQYGNTDIGMRRTASDLYSALELTEEFGLTKTDVNYLSSALMFMSDGCIRIDGTSKSFHRDDIVARMRIYAPCMREYVALIAGGEHRMRVAAMRGATLSIALLTLRFSTSLAERRGDPSVPDFWRGVVFDDGIQIGDPRKVANRHLLNTAMNNNSTRASHITTPPYSARFITNCFNAYAKRRELLLTRVLDSRAPLNLYGVPSDPSLWW